MVARKDITPYYYKYSWRGWQGHMCDKVISSTLPERARHPTRASSAFPTMRHSIDDPRDQKFSTSTGSTTVISLSPHIHRFYQALASPRLEWISINKQKGEKVGEKSNIEKPKVVRSVGASTPREPISSSWVTNRMATRKHGKPQWKNIYYLDMSEVVLLHVSMRKEMTPRSRRVHSQWEEGPIFGWSSRNYLKS